MLDEYDRCEISEEALCAEFEKRYFEFQPWNERPEALTREQTIIQRILSQKAGAKFGRNCFVSREAAVFTWKLELGDNSWIAAGAIIRGRISIGSNSTVNPYAHIAGLVTIGSGVRIAGSAAIYGFNHGISRTDVPIFQQPHTHRGIRIGDNTWVGANAVIVDGCDIGNDCLIAAGAVVTKSYPPFQIIGGNPARVIRDRRAK